MHNKLNFMHHMAHARFYLRIIFVKTARLSCILISTVLYFKYICDIYAYINPLLIGIFTSILKVYVNILMNVFRRVINIYKPMNCVVLTLLI